MKNISLFTILLTAFMFMGVSDSFAKDSSSTTRVRGNVYDQVNGVPINGLSISVTCNGITKTGNTDSNGLYVVDFTKAECDKFDPVSATGSFNGEVLNKSVLVSSVNTATMDFDFGLVAVPEFGLIQGAMAAVGSGIAFLGLKRRFI